MSLADHCDTVNLPHFDLQGASQLQSLRIQGIPAKLWGQGSQDVCLYVHGQGGGKEEAEMISRAVCECGYQLLSIDLPEHGSRMVSSPAFVPWNVVPELKTVMQFLQSRWQTVTLVANSIGAWFSMLAFGGMNLKQSLFISPIVSMKSVITSMMEAEHVSEERLKRELAILTAQGQELSWKYWTYALTHPISQWDTPTAILYGGQDALIKREDVEHFSQHYQCELQVFEHGEHWFHTKQQMDVEISWITDSLSKVDKGTQTAFT